MGRATKENTLTREEDAKIFMSLKNLSAQQTGWAFHLEERTKTEGLTKEQIGDKIAGRVHDVKSRVEKNPQNYTTYGIGAKEIETIQKACQARIEDGQVRGRVAGHRDNNLKQREEDLEFAKMLKNLRNRAWSLIGDKMEQAENDEEVLKKINFRDLVVVGGTAFDKTQILSGLATEHIAMKGRIDSNLSPEDLLKEVLVRREANIESNREQKKK